MQRKTYICTTCDELGEESLICRHAWIVWDDETQDWRLSQTWAEMFCPNCDDSEDEYTIKEVSLNN